MSVLYRDGINGPVSVVGSEANTRTSRGITDAFGHMWNWLDNLDDPTKLTQEDTKFLRLARILRDASWSRDPQSALVDNRDAYVPGYYDGLLGVRFVAVPASGVAVAGTPCFGRNFGLKKPKVCIMESRSITLVQRKTVHMPRPSPPKGRGSGWST